MKKGRSIVIYQTFAPGAKLLAAFGMKAVQYLCRVAVGTTAFSAIDPLSN
ncbi:hypothetical protein [Anaeromassilibacillus sp. SJQ-1]